VSEKEDNLRVISGKAKGRRLEGVAGRGTRPITDRAKSALFSILGDLVRYSTFLDLFAGTGQVGIEALSRDAERAVFVEQSPAAIRVIRRNLEHTELGAGAVVVRADVFKFLWRDPDPCDYIFIAPPQYRGLWRDTLTLIDRHSGWLAEDGWVIVQIHPREFEEVPLQNLRLFDQRKYGGVMLCFYGRPSREMSGASDEE
jgi:16S rRNA (guanine(966)-N(2))-methyltransferase RsmD